MDILTYTLLKKKLGAKADLINGKIPAEELPSYVDDVLEYASLNDFPVEGEEGKIYVATDTGFTYRWSGSIYVQIGGQEPPVNDVQVNGSSVLDNKIANIQLKTIEGKTIVGEGDISLPTYTPFPSSWRTDSITHLLTDANADTSAVVGKSYLGEVTHVTAAEGLFDGNAEIVLNIMNGTTPHKVIWCIVSSNNITPYHWEATFSSGTISPKGWTGYQPELVSGTNIKTINNTSILGSGNIDTQELFYCTYGTTTYAQITQALSDGKLPVCIYSNRFYKYDLKSPTDRYIFNASYADALYSLNIQSNDTWGAGNYQFEITSNKVTSISSGSTDVQYPSAKAVYGQLALKQDVLTAGTGIDISSNTISVDSSVVALQTDLPEGEIDINFNDNTTTATSGTLSNIVIGNSTDGYTRYNITTTSSSASSGGSTLSLVTTGEKYTWNNKQTALTTSSISSGTPTQVIGFNSSNNLVRGTYSAGMSNPMTTSQDIIVGGSSGTPTRLAKGNNGELLRVNSSGNIAYGKNLPIITTAPSAANTDGLIICVLSSEPATKYDGYLYIITSSNNNAQTPTTFTFTIETTVGGSENSETYTAETGMTWAQWVASNYNTDGYIINNFGYVVNQNGSLVTKPNVNSIPSTDTIIANDTYYASDVESGGSND